MLISLPSQKGENKGVAPMNLAAENCKPNSYSTVNNTHSINNKESAEKNTFLI